MVQICSDHGWPKVTINMSPFCHHRWASTDGNLQVRTSFQFIMSLAFFLLFGLGCQMSLGQNHGNVGFSISPGGRDWKRCLTCMKVWCSTRKVCWFTVINRRFFNFNIRGWLIWCTFGGFLLRHYRTYAIHLQEKCLGLATNLMILCELPVGLILKQNCQQADFGYHNIDLKICCYQAWPFSIKLSCCEKNSWLEVCNHVNQDINFELYNKLNYIIWLTLQQVKLSWVKFICYQLGQEQPAVFVAVKLLWHFRGTSGCNWRMRPKR